jgi:AcrR family transcriptional regulator
MVRGSHYLNQGARPAKRPTTFADPNTPTRQRLLKAGRKLFATHGYAGASVRDITAAAGANLSAVTYHFGVKENLYITILQSIVGPLAHTISGIVTYHRPPLERIERVVRTVFEYIGQNPDLPSFMVREMSAFPPSGPLVQMLERVIPDMAAVIAEGQRQKSIRPGDPTLMVLSIFAQPVYLYLTRKATGIPMNDERVVEHAVAFVRAGLER